MKQWRVAEDGPLDDAAEEMLRGCSGWCRLDESCGGGRAEIGRRKGKRCCVES